MSRRTGVLRFQSPPLGHAFAQDPADGPVANAQARLITSYRVGQATWPPDYLINPDGLQHVEPDSSLRSDYEQAMTHAARADREYRRHLRSLLQTFPQGDGEDPTRPTPEQMQVLFKKVLYHDQVRPRGKGSKGGVKHYECKWPDCQFKGPLQKCMDHFFCEHVELKFFRCEQPDCGIKFLRKYDLDKHKKKQHSLLRPRETRNESDRRVAGPSRQTRSRGLNQHQPYPTQGRSTRGRPAIERSQDDGDTRTVAITRGVRKGIFPLKNPLRSDVPKISSALDPRTASSTRTAELTQTKPSGPLGQASPFPFMFFHTMLSVYIARQAIHLVIILNDLVDVQVGPDDEQYQERIDLEDELIGLFDAMREWGAKPDEGHQVDYDQGLLKINQQYAQFFRERFYFHNVRNSVNDFIYDKLAAYDRKTIDFRKWKYSRPDPTSMDVDLNGSNNFQPTINPRSIPASQPGGQEVTGIKEEEIKEEEIKEEEMHVDLESGVVAMDVTP